MIGLANCTVLGTLVNTPELKILESGNAVLNLRLAVNSSKKDSNDKNFTDFFDAVIWKKHAEALAPHLSVGKNIYITGELRTREWETKDGQKRNTVEVNVSELRFVDKVNKED